jgi:2-polyprenyl-6-hydroxyphenyl methylase/3-demethylubiquinone-9 3-methyltransferase
MSTQHTAEIDAGQRFEFGKNWQRFLQRLDDKRVAQAESSLLEFLDLSEIEGLRFADVGCGSGLFSLAARRLGAVVHSLDYDPSSVACARYLRGRYFPEDRAWTIEEGSALDRRYLESLGPFDVVYSWGVLHHTGSMWEALENAGRMVKPGGRLFVSIYNDQGVVSRRWTAVKRFYNKHRWVRPVLLPACFWFLYWRPLVKDLLFLRPFQTIRNYGAIRGMSIWTDLVDWVGGYPFEVAKPEQIFEFYRDRGFTLVRMKTCNDLGCNEFVFRREGP